MLLMGLASEKEEFCRRLIRGLCLKELARPGRSILPQVAIVRIGNPRRKMKGYDVAGV